MCLVFCFFIFILSFKLNQKIFAINRVTKLTKKNDFSSTASHHIKHSPGSQSGRNSNLRVVIPNSGMSGPDDNNISYGEVSSNARY